MQQWLHNAYWFLQLLFVLFLSSNIIYHYTYTANQLLEMKGFEQKKNKINCIFYNHERGFLV